MRLQIWWIKTVVVILYTLTLGAFAIQYHKRLAEIRTNMINTHSKPNCFDSLIQIGFCRDYLSVLC